MTITALTKSIIITSACLLIGSGCTLKKPNWTQPSASARNNSTGLKQIKVNKQSYAICNDCILIKKGQVAVHSTPKSVQGMVESLHIMGDKVQFQGWAADIKLKGPIDKILIFANDRLVHEGSALLERLDIAKSLQDSAMLRSGFSVLLDKNLFVDSEGKEASISVFAVKKNNTGVKLPFKNR